MQLRFDSQNTFYKKPFGAVAVGTAIAFCAELLGQEDPDLSRLWPVLSVSEDGKEEQSRNGWWMPNGKNENCLATCQFSFVPEKAGLFFYCLRIYEEGNLVAETQPLQLTVYKESYQTPEWLSGGLMYQIFPDRFARSASTPLPSQKKNVLFHENWGEEPQNGPDENGIVWNNDFFGGNLRGIEEHLEDLRQMGVTVIYLNPIFTAYSNHRYDTANYMEIDPMLGTEADFISLCQNARSKGMHIILDGVFNHTGSHSIYFNKDGAFSSLGAFQSKDSPYYNWYSFQEYPWHYDSWWGIDTLPAVNEMQESYRDYIIRSENSVIKHWMRLGASGFRLDVADELPDEFIEEVRSAVKSIQWDGALIGEVWEDATNKISYGKRRRYFQGDELDSVMNYPLKDGLIDFLTGRKDGTFLQNEIMELMEHYPPMSFRCLMNILGTHDTPRILTVFQQAAEQEMAANQDLTANQDLAAVTAYEKARQKLFQALLVWAFLPGIPCIYYGDEWGMEGGRDPANRRCFQPNQGKKEINLFYRHLLHFRNQVSHLQTMEYLPGSLARDQFSFQRQGKHQRLLVFLNRLDQDYSLSLNLTEDEVLLDFINCGKMTMDGENHIRLGSCSGIAALIASKTKNI